MKQKYNKETKTQEIRQVNKKKNDHLKTPQIKKSCIN